MIATTQELMAELRARGLAKPGGAVAPAPRGESGRPWYVTLLLGGAGWLAGLFLLVFIFLAFNPTSAPGAFFIGPVLLLAAWGLFWADREGAFVSQLAIALSVAGQVAVLFGIGDAFFKRSNEIASIALVALIMQAALVVAMPNRLHRTMSTLFACVAWALFVRYALWDAPEWRSFDQPRPAPSATLALGGWAMAWLPIGGLLYALVRTEATWMAQGRQAIARPAAVGLIVGLAWATLLSQPLEALHLADMRQGWLAIWPLLSALAALAALAGAFALGNRGLTAVCILAALAHVSLFYYAMGTTLLVKAAAMIALGAILLGAAHALKRGVSR